MRWWKQYCCCWNSDEKLLNDTQQQSNNFCVPRRHSSFHATTDHEITHQKFSSSSDEEEGHQRERSWSTISTTDLISKKKSKSSSFSNVTSYKADKFSFDRHILTEIVEEESTHSNDDVCGRITFSTSYDEGEHKLHVFVEKATSLPGKGSHQETYDTFVKLSIIFSNKNFSTSTTSRTVKKTLSPIYREDHVFHTNCSKWADQTCCLKLSVFECGRQGRHDAIGHALLPLSQMSCQKHALPLTPMSIPTKKNLGQVLIGLLYLPSQSLLRVEVVKARHLDSDIRKICKETLDTFVKVNLMCAGQKVKSNASRVVFGTSEPFYHFKNSFVLPPQFLLDASIVVSVVVREILGRSFTLGRIVSGPYTELREGTTAPTHWGKMVNENRNVVQWRNLYL